MSVEIRWEESHSDDSTDVEVIVSGPTTRNDLFADLIANLPASYGTYSLKALKGFQLVAGHLDLWTGTASYGPYRQKTEIKSGEMEFRFSSATRTITRTYSRASLVYALVGGVSTDVTADTPDARIIGYKEHSKRAEGVQVTEWINSFSWRIAVPFSTATETWRRDIGNLRGSVNDAAFFGYAAGEVQFQDITGSVRADDDYLWDLSFLQSENETSLAIGGITIPSKRAWDYLDIDDQSLKFHGPPVNRILPEVQRVKVHEVFASKDWSLMGTLLGV